MRTYIYLYPTGRADVQYEGAAPGRENRATCPGAERDPSPFDPAHKWGTRWEARFAGQPGRRALALLLRLASREFCGRCRCIRMTFESREDA